MDSTDYQHDTFLCGQLFSPSCKKLQLADKIEKELGNKEETNWKLLIKLAREVEVIQNEIEDIAATKTEINMVMCLSDVLQASCLAVLIMRPELRIRGFFRNEFIQTYLPNFELILIKTLMGIGFMSPCLRAFSFVTGGKQSLLSFGGLALIVSIVLGLLPSVITMIILGSNSVFFIPLPTIFLSLVIFLFKVCFDKDFSKMPFDKMVIHAFTALFFIKTTERKSTTKEKELEKNSTGEVIFLYLVNLTQTVMVMAIFGIYPQFFEKTFPFIDISILLFVVSPASLLLSLLTRLIYFSKHAWAFGRTKSALQTLSGVR